MLFFDKNKEAFQIRTNHRVEFFSNKFKKVVKVDEPSALLVHLAVETEKLHDLVFTELESVSNVFHLACLVNRHILLLSLHPTQQVLHHTF